MNILGIRTDKPEAELYLYDSENKLVEERWQGHRKLSVTLNSKIEQILKSQKMKLSDLEGIVVYEGPGSFTGLRIGSAVANALADGLVIPVVGAGSDNWLGKGIKSLLSGQNNKVVIPKYGREANITTPKK